jgi:hypothetical protein
MEHDLGWLKAVIAKRTQETWERVGRPYYISFIATDLAKEGADYKEIIAPLKLRQWAMTADIEGIKAVAHPVHKAKVGFVPAAEKFEFEAEEAVQAEGRTRLSKPINTRRSTFQFLEALAALPDEELDQIDIPVGTIVRLLRG